MGARAIESNRCSRKSTRGRGWSNVSRRSASSGGSRPGFGHAIYPAGDPRAVLLKKEAAEIARHRGRRLFETALRIEETVWRRERLRPNLDFYLTVCARMLGFARGTARRDFRVGRAAGWIAHSLEQYADNRLIRPRMRYRGYPCVIGT